MKTTNEDSRGERGKTLSFSNVHDFPIVFFRDVVVMPGSFVSRMPVTLPFLEACEKFREGRRDIERSVERNSSTSSFFEKGIMKKASENDEQKQRRRRVFVGVIQCETIPIDGEENDDASEKEYVGTVCEIVFVDEKERKELISKEGSFWFVNEGRYGTHENQFSLDASRCTYACLIGTGIKCALKKISRLPPKPLYDELYGQFYVPNDDMTDEEARTVRINLRRYYEVHRNKIRAAREGTVVDLFQDGNAETKQSARYLKKLDPSRAILKTAKVTCESLLKEATKCAAMVNRCGGNDRLAKSMNDGTFPYIFVANSPAPVPFCRFDLLNGLFEITEDVRDIIGSKYEQRISKSLLESTSAVEACFAAGKNLFRDGETAEAEEGIAEPIGTTGRVLKHAKEEVSYLQCRECHSPFGNASKAIKAINPPVHEETIDPILVYGPGASKIFFNPHLHECEILTASASHLYSFTRPNISPAFYDVGWTGSAEEVNPFRCFFDRYGWSSESCYCCRNFIGWKFERLSEREEDEEENELPRIFFGFLKNQVQTSKIQSREEEEKCKSTESETDRDWNYRRMHETFREEHPMRLVPRQEAVSSDDDDDGNDDVDYAALAEIERAAMEELGMRMGMEDEEGEEEETV